MSREEFMAQIEASVEYGLTDDLLCYMFMSKESKNYTPEEIIAMYKEATLNFLENFEYDDDDDDE